MTARQLIFRSANLQYLQEIGGSRRLDGATMSAVNQSNGEFLTVYPRHSRLRQYESFGGEIAKWKVDDVVSVGWDDQRQGYVVGYADRSVRWYGPTLSAVTKSAQTEQVVPRKIIPCPNGELLTTDFTESIVHIDENGTARVIKMDSPVCDLCHSPDENDLIIVTGGAVHVIGTSGKQGRYVKKKFTYEGDRAVSAVGPDGDIWLAATVNGSRGQLYRYRADDYHRSVVADSVKSPTSIIVLERLVIVGDEKGELQIFDHQGHRIGREKLGVNLSHLALGPGRLIIVSTAKGPSVLIPHEVACVESDRHQQRERALDLVKQLEVASKSSGTSSYAADEFLQAIDLRHWPLVLSIKEVIRARRKSEPHLYKKILRALELKDQRKAACLTKTSRPVFIDGSNVSRHRQSKGHARLGF